ncbi:hypothetical protein Droror1_Dr00017498 [Drosera rotundifolia]
MHKLRLSALETFLGPQVVDMIAVIKHLSRRLEITRPPFARTFALLTVINRKAQGLMNGSARNFHFKLEENGIECFFPGT